MGGVAGKIDVRATKNHAGAQSLAKRTDECRSGDCGRWLDRDLELAENQAHRKSDLVIVDQFELIDEATAQAIAQRGCERRAQTIGYRPNWACVCRPSVGETEMHDVRACRLYAVYQAPWI